MHLGVVCSSRKKCISWSDFRKQKNALCFTECDIGFYGDECKNLCSEHCYGKDNSCHHENGTCDLGCDEGYQTALCSQRKSYIHILILRF